MTEKMHIEGIEYPKAAKSGTAPKAIALFRLKHFAWSAMLGALALGVALYGTPHLRFIYQYSGSGKSVFYHTCDYVGWHSQRIVPRDGNCPLIQFLK